MEIEGREARDLLERALKNPEAYWEDIEQWIESADERRVASGHMIAGKLFRYEDPGRSLDHYEEARRISVSRGFYLEAAKVVEEMAEILIHEMGDLKGARSQRELSSMYQEAARRFDPPKEDFLDDIDD